MSAIVVRAADSSQAMEEVLRRLGNNAYILSTSHRDGQVEIHAATELPPATGTASANEPRFVDVLAGVQMQHGPAVVQPSPEQPKVYRSDSPVETSDTVGFADDLRNSLARLAPDPEAGFLDRLAADLLLGEDMRSDITRVVVVGPAGSGKSMFAARLAARLMTENRSIQPRLIAPRRGFVASEDRLRGWARLMGLDVERPKVRDMLVDPLWDAKSAIEPQIIDLSDIPDVTVAEVVELAVNPATQVVLVLPSGLQPGVVAHYCARWQPAAPQVCLSRLDDWTPNRSELSELVNAGVRLGWLSAGTGLVGALTRPVWDDLKRWAEAWLTMPSLPGEQP